MTVQHAIKMAKIKFPQLRTGQIIAYAISHWYNDAHMNDVGMYLANMTDEVLAEAIIKYKDSF